MGRRVLVVDDEPLKRATLQIELGEHGYEVEVAGDAETARRLLDSHPVDVVVSDVRMPGMDGLELLSHVKKLHPETDVILMTAYGTIETAVLAIKRGAYDYIPKPFTTDELLVKLERLFASRARTETANVTETFGHLVARSRAMKHLFQQLRRVAVTDRTVLLRGERGTGKELCAEAIHEHSLRAGKPLVRVRCRALMAEGQEHELFGQSGLDTHSLVHQPSRLELAQGGTLLLDEVHALSAAAQGELLRVIDAQEHAAQSRRGNGRPAVRFICTTTEDLRELAAAGRFNDDLCARLSGVSLVIPPLRERPEDIALLAEHFARKHVALAAGRMVRLRPEALDELLRHAWPGNVRELEHVMQRALVACVGDEIRPEHILPLGPESAAPALPVCEVRPNLDKPLTDAVAEVEREMILNALRACHSNQAQAARRLGIPRTTLRDKMARYGIGSGHSPA
jgi:DNA-binding NtrC family response regulator